MQLETLGEKYGLSAPSQPCLDTAVGFGHTQGVEAGKREAAGGLLGARVAAVSGRASDTSTPKRFPSLGSNAGSQHTFQLNFFLTAQTTAYHFNLHFFLS